MSGRNPVPREQSYEGVKAVNPPDIISAKRNPLPSDFKYPLGTMWMNTVTEVSFQLVSNPGIWAILGGAAGGDVQSLTADNAFAVTPALGTINVAGGPNITTSGAGSTLTIQTVASPTFTDLTVNGNEILGGNLTSATGAINLVDGTITLNTGDLIVEEGNIEVTLGTITAGTGFITDTVGYSCTTSGNFSSLSGSLLLTDGDALIGGGGSVVSLTGADSQYRLHGGAATDFIGTAVLVGGTIAILNTNIAANDRVFIQRITAGGTIGDLTYVIVAATSLTINSDSALDTSTITYFIVRQTP